MQIRLQLLMQQSSNIRYRQLQLTNGSFAVNSGDNYIIYSNVGLSSVRASGSDTSGTNGYIYDNTGATPNIANVIVGDYVINNTTTNWTKVAAAGITDYKDLQLSVGTYIVNGTANYYISDSAAPNLPGSKASGMPVFTGTAGYLRATYTAALNTVVANDWVAIDLTQQYQAQTALLTIISTI